MQVIGFKVDADLKEKIERLAEKEDRSQSSVIRRLLLRALAANEKTA